MFFNVAEFLIRNNTACDFIVIAPQNFMHKQVIDGSKKIMLPFFGLASLRKLASRKYGRNIAAGT